MFNSTKKEVPQDESAHSSSIIGKGTVLEGDLNTTGNIRVEGKVGGSIQTKAKLVLGNTSSVKGNVVAQTAEISGEVRGTIEVSGLLTLKATAVVNGDINANKLVFEEGARFNGKCNMGSIPKESLVIQTRAIAHKKNEDLSGAHLQHATLPPEKVEST